MIKLNFLRKGDCLVRAEFGDSYKVAIVTVIDRLGRKFNAVLFYVSKEHIEKLKEETLFDVDLETYNRVQSGVAHDVSWRIWNSIREATTVIDNSSCNMLEDGGGITCVTPTGSYYVLGGKNDSNGYFGYYLIDSCVFSRAHIWNLKERVLGARKSYISKDTFDKVNAIYDKLYEQLAEILDLACQKY